MKFSIARHPGQSLIEAIITVAVVVIIVIGLIVSANFSLTYGAMNKKRTKALSLACDAFEVARSVRSISWEDLPAAGTSYCLGKGETSFVTTTPEGGCPVTIDDTYSRTVQFSVESDAAKPCTDSTQCRKMMVTVGWIENSKVRTVTLSTYITNWKHL